jgi:hypothetical protein
VKSRFFAVFAETHVHVFKADCPNQSADDFTTSDQPEPLTFEEFIARSQANNVHFIPCNDSVATVECDIFGTSIIENRFQMR